ncbi:MAG: hypothetical protein SGPRY_008929, partial [Prymnesium sp.]
MTSGNLAAWKKKEGEEIAVADVIAEVETDKATVEYEAQDDGFLAKILLSSAGRAQEVAVGVPIGGISLSGVVGSGPGGRIIAADVSEAISAPKSEKLATPSAAVPAPPTGAGYVDLPNSNIRKVTAKRMVENKNSLPHYYLQMEDVKTSVNDYVIKACSLALMEVPECNSSYTEEYIRQFSSADISVAVNTDRGLLTPIVFGAESKNVTQIATDVKMLAAKAKEGKLQPAEFIGGTFTVSNLGMFGLKQFTAIINSPQA